MGVFSKNQKETAANIYESTKKYLKPKDGNKHVVMINSYSKFINQIFSCDDKYTIQIDEIVSKMQQDGYEICDIKLGVLQGQGIFQAMEGFYSLIIYK